MGAKNNRTPRRIVEEIERPMSPKEVEPEEPKIEEPEDPGMAYEPENEADIVKEEAVPAPESIDIPEPLQPALKALGIKYEEVMGWRAYDDKVVIVTGGGQKLTYRA